MATLRSRIDALEAQAPKKDVGVTLILRTFVNAVKGKPAGRDDWDAPPPEGVVWLSGVKHSAEPGETAAVAARRLADAQPSTTPRSAYIATLRPCYRASEQA